MRVSIITTDKHDGEVVTLSILPRKGDTFELDGVRYTVHGVKHYVNLPRLGKEQIQEIALVLVKDY